MQNTPSLLVTPERPCDHFKMMVAKVLLEYAEDSKTERRQLAQRDIALLAGTDWETVHTSLKSLHDEKAIRIEHHRIIINKELLHKVVG